MTNLLKPRQSFLQRCRIQAGTYLILQNMTFTYIPRLKRIGGNKLCTLNVRTTVVLYLAELITIKVRGVILHAIL
jgi:hypothetical protein